MTSAEHHRCAVFTVVHPGTAPFQAEFFASVEMQTDQDFVLVVAVDSVPLPDLALQAVPVQVSGSPSSIRKQGIAFCASLQVGSIIFADADDLMHPKRVETLKHSLNHETDVVGHDFIPFRSSQSPSGPLPTRGALTDHWHDGHRFTLGDLLHGNPIGLGASAVSTRAALAASQRVDDEADVFDWDFFTILAANNFRLTYRDAALTYYRQHGSEVGWTPGPLQSARVKARHYRRLRELVPGFDKLAAAYNKLSIEIATSTSNTTPPLPHTSSRGWWYDTIVEADQ